MLGGLRVRLVDEVWSCWKWSSMRFLALGGVVQCALLAFPMQLQQYLPSWLLSGLAEFVLFCLIAAGVGRLTQVEKPDVQHSDTANLDR